MGAMAGGGERRDVVWGKYVNGKSTVSKWTGREHATASEVGQGLGDSE